MSGFACPPDCGHCCTHLEREPEPEERRALLAYRAMLRDEGVYGCADAPYTGLSLSNEEAAALRDDPRGRVIHPRTWLIETRRRLAVVLDWHMPRSSCVFYEDFRCTVYEKRPLVCRAYPVMMGAPKWKLAPACPLTETTVAAGGLGSLLRVESRARRAIESRTAAFDERAFALLSRPELRFAKGLPRAEAAKRMRRYRVVAPESV